MWQDFEDARLQHAIKGPARQKIDPRGSAKQAGSREVQLYLVNVAPSPALAGLNRPHDGVICRMKVLGGVLVFRRIAAAHMPAGQAQAQMNPAVAGLEAFLASMRMRPYVVNLIEMCTGMHSLLFNFRQISGQRHLRLPRRRQSRISRIDAQAWIKEPQEPAYVRNWTPTGCNLKTCHNVDRSLLILLAVSARGEWGEAMGLLLTSDSRQGQYGIDDDGRGRGKS